MLLNKTELTYWQNFFQVFWIPLLKSCLGIFISFPFRQYKSATSPFQKKRQKKAFVEKNNLNLAAILYKYGAYQFFLLILINQPSPI